MNNLHNELTNGRGYAVLPIKNMDIFRKLRNSFFKKMEGFDAEENNIDLFRKKMVSMSNAAINKSMVNLLSFTDASEMMIDSCSDLVERLSGKELFIQRRANTIFNLPGKNQRRQWPHYELMSGISPFSYVLWAPFHDLEDNGGVFYINQEKSLEIIKKEHSEGLVNGPTILNMIYDQKPEYLKFGEVIIFNPFILHGNINFDSGFARIACSVRFQSSKKPLLQKNTDYLKYYKLN